MKAGFYFVGDLCYVLHEVWDEVCNLTYPTNFTSVEGKFTLKDGRKFALFNTKCGDGEYFDNFGNKYGVDAGCIGCILVTDIDQNVDGNNISLGHVHDFAEGFVTDSFDGCIRLGRVFIDTSADEDYEEIDGEYA